MRFIPIHLRLPKYLVRRLLAAGIAFVYGATNVVFCHAAEASFWSARRNASKKMAQSGATSGPAPTDALILAQLPGGARLNFQGPIESSVIPTVPAKEHMVGGKVPVFASDLPRWLADVITPYGNMRDVFLSKRPDAPLVIQIQDLHDSTEAQRNIAGLVEALQDDRGISLVGLEGAQGAFATEAFRSFPDADITKAVAEHFMEEGYLGGPEFAGITAKRMPLLWGVEDMDGYKANVAAVKEAAINRPAVNLFLSEARQILDTVKDRRLSVPLLEFDKHLTGYHSRKEPLGTYVRYLLKSSPQSVAHVPNLVLLRDALHWEETLDFKRIEGERAALLERMVNNLSKANLERLVGRSAQYRLGRISYGDYYRFLRALCEDSGVKLDDYAQLSAYVRYVLLAERINRNDLLTELSSLERNVQDGLVSTAEEQRIVDSARHLALLERLVKHAYTPSDWVYHMTHETEILNVGNVIGTLAQQTGTPHHLSPPTVETLKPFEDFCLQALGRNGAMVKNLLEKMKAENRTTAVLVAGGFHTEGLTQLLRQKDISYAVVTPKVNGPLPDGHRTLELLARDPAPLEKLFAGETINIPTPRMVGQDNPGSFDLIAKLRNGFGIFLLAMFVWTSNAPVKPLDTAAVAAASIMGEFSATAVPQKNNSVRISFQGKEGNLVYVAHPNTPLLSGEGSLNIQPRQISVQSVPIALSFMEQLRSWQTNVSSRSLGVWNQTIVALGSLLLVISVWASGIKGNNSGAKNIRRVLSFFGISTFSTSVWAATGTATLAPASVGLLTIAITLVGLWGLGQLLKAKALQPLILGWAQKLSGLRMQFPGVYFFMGGLLKSIVFPSLGLTILPGLLGGIGLSPALSFGLGILWATGGYWMAAPLGRAVREGFSWGKLTKEIRSEYRYTRRFRSHSRLSGAFITSGVFVLGLISGFWTAVFIAAGANALWERFRPRGPPGDPFRPAWMGYVTLVWLLLTTPVDQIHVASGDGDDFSSLNGRFGKEMVGIAPGGSLSKRMYFSKRSLFWSRRIEQAKIAKENGFRISRGSGGDEYFVVMKGSGDKVGDAFKNSVKEFNAFGLVNVEGHWRPREVFFTFPNSLDKNQRKALENWGPSIALGKREGGLILSVDRKNTNLTIEKLKDKIKELAGLGETSPVNEVSWDAPDGVAVFTTSMGSVSILDVIRILIIGGTQSNFKDSSLNNAPPNLHTFEKQWIGKENRIKWSKIPEIMVWAFRLPNDALKGSKTGSLTEEGAIKTRSQRKNQAYSLAETDIIEMGLKAVTPEALVQTRRQWWRGLFRLGRSGVDSLSGTLTQNIFHQRLKDSSPAFMYRLDIASYGNSQNFFERRGFHNRQGNNYPYGNQLIMLVGAAIGLTLNGVQLISRDGPDTYYIASNKEISQDQLNLLVTEIKNNLARNLLKDQANSEDVVWDPHVALYEVSRKGFEQLNAETTKEDSEPSNWPFIALKQLDQMADAVKVLGEQNPLNKIGLDPANFKHTENIIRVAFPNTQSHLKAFEENVEKVAERIVGERSNRNLGVSSQGKAGIAVMAWGVLFGVGILFNYYFGGDVLGMTVGGAALAAMTRVIGNPITNIVNPNGRPQKDHLTPLDFSSQWDLIAERYASLREAYRHSHKITEYVVDNKIWSISRYPFRFPKENKSQADDYFNMVVGMCTEWKSVGRGRNRKEVPSPDSDLLRLVLYERANRLISIAKKRNSQEELSQEELSEMNWVSNVFSPLAAALPEDESVEYLFGMNISAVLTDLMFYIADPNVYESKRNGISNYLGGSAGAYSLKNGIETAIRSISPSPNHFDVRLKAVASVLNKSIEKPARYGRVDDFGDLVTGTIVINNPNSISASNWSMTVETTLERILNELKKDDPEAMVKPLTPDQISEGNSNPDYKEIGITHVNIIYRRCQIELQFKDRIHYERLIVGDRVSSVGAVAHYIRKAKQIKKRLKEMLGFEELQLRAHRTPIVGNFKKDFAAFWERARRYTIVTALTEAEKKNPEKKVDTIRLPAGAIVADLLAHSRADTDFSFNAYQNASRIEGAETVVLQANIQPPLALMAPLTTGDQIKISGPYQEMRGRDKREEIRKAARTFRLRYKAVEENDLKAYADRGFTFLNKHGLVIQLKSSFGRPGKNQTPWAMVDKTKDTLNSFLIKHDVDLDMFAVLVGEELGREGSSLTDQRNVIERLMRDFMVRGEIYARRALKNADGISSDGAQEHIEKFMKTLSEPLKSNLFELANIVVNNNKLNEFTGYKLPTIAYLIGVGRLDIEPITQNEKIEIKKLRILFRYKLVATDRPGLATQVFSIAKRHGLNNGNLREIDLSVKNGKATISVGVSEEVSNPDEIEQKLGQINTSTYNSDAVYDQNRRTGWSFSIPKNKDLVDLILDLGAICKKFNINILAFKVSKDPGEQGVGEMDLGLPDNISDADLRKAKSSLVTIFPHFDHDNTSPPSGGLWFNHEGYRSWAFLMETPILFGLIEAARIVLGSGFGLVISPEYFFLLFPVLFWVPHLFFNSKVAFTRDVGFLTLAKLSIGFLFWGPQASVVSMVMAVFLLAYVTYKHFIINGGNALAFRNLRPLVIALAFVSAGLLLGFPIDSIAGEVATVNDVLRETANLNGLGVVGLGGLFLLALGLRDAGREEVTYKGASNGIDEIVVGVVMYVEPETYGGEVYSYYSLATKREMENEKKRAEEAFAAQETSSSIDSLTFMTLKESVLKRIHNKMVNAQGIVAEVLDEEISSAQTKDQGDFISLKSGLLSWLRDTHSLKAVVNASDPKAMDAAIQLEQNKLDALKQKVWETVAGGMSGWNDPPETWDSDASEAVTILRNRLDFLTSTIDFGKSQIKSRHISAMGYLAGLHQETSVFLAAINQGVESVDPQIEQGFIDNFLTLVAMIAELQPKVRLSNLSEENARFLAALKSINPHDLTDIQRELLGQLENRVPSMIGQNRTAESSVLLEKDRFLAGKSYGDDNETVDQDVAKQVDAVLSNLLEAMINKNLDLDHPLKGKTVVVVSEKPLVPQRMGDIKALGVVPSAYVSFTGSIGMHGPTVATAEGIPYLTSVDGSEGKSDIKSQLTTGEVVVVDGRSGAVTVRANNATFEMATARQLEIAALKSRYKANRENKSEVVIYSSPDAISEISKGEESGALGVALFRTEWFYLDKRNSPLKDGRLSKDFEDSLSSLITEAAKKTKGKFNVRVLDYTIGNDKPLEALPRSAQTGANYLIHDGSPFALQEIRAIMRAYLDSPNIQISFPKVSTVEEAKVLREMVDGTRASFGKGEQMKLNDLQVGAMIETREAVENIDKFSEIIDFFMLGTKDLNMSSAGITDPNDPKLNKILNGIELNFIRNVIKVLVVAKRVREGGKSSLTVGACGTLAGKEIFLPMALLLNQKYGMAISVSPALVERFNYLLLNIAEQTELLGELDALLDSGTGDELTAKSQEILEATHKAILDSQEYKNELIKQTAIQRTRTWDLNSQKLEKVRIALLKKWIQRLPAHNPNRPLFVAFFEKWGEMFLARDGVASSNSQAGAETDAQKLWGMFSRWTFNVEKINTTELRVKLLELLRFRNDLLNNDQLERDMVSVSQGAFSLESFDQAIALLAVAIGEGNLFEELNVPQAKKSGRNIEEEVDDFISMLSVSAKEFKKIRATDVVAQANRILKIIGRDNESRKALLIFLNASIPSKRMESNQEIQTVLINLRRWVDATRIVTEAQQLTSTITHWKTTPKARINRLITKYRALLFKDKTSFRAKENLFFVSDVLRGNRKDSILTSLLTAALGNLMGWNISNPLPVKMMPDNVEIIDLDALAGKTDLSLSQGMPKQGGFLGFPLLLAGLLVPVAILTFFLTGSTFGVDVGGASLVNLAELEKILYVLLGVTASQKVITVADKSSGPPGNSPYTKTINAALQGIREEIRGDLTPQDVQVIVGPSELEKSESSIGYLGNRKTWVKEEGERLRVLIGQEFIAEWASKEDNKFNRRKKGVVLYAGYLYTVLQTVFLAALAQDKGVAREILEREGLSVKGVDALFQAGVGAREIQRIQVARYRTLRALYLDVVTSPASSRDAPFDAETLFPLNRMPLEETITMGGLMGDRRPDENKERLRARLASLVDTRKNNEALASQLIDVAEEVNENAVDFRPNAMALKLNGVLSREKSYSLNHARVTLARSFVTRNSNGDSFKSLEENSNKSNWRVLSLLFGMNGSLSEGFMAQGRSEEESSVVRRIYQNLDLKLMANISSLMGEEIERGPDYLNQGVEAFNHVAEQSSMLRDPHTAVAEFLKGGDIVFFISPAMAQGVTPLTPAERTMLDTIKLLDRRLNDAADSEANVWRGQGHRVVLGVLDPSNGKATYAQETVIANVEKLTGTERVRGDLRALRLIARLQVDVFIGTPEGIQLRDKFTQLNLKDANVFALEAPDLKVDYSDLKGLISLLTFALSGGLLCRASVGDSLKAIRAVRISA